MSKKAERIVRSLMIHRDVTQEILRRVPDDSANFRPWEGAFTLAELGCHMAATYHMFVEIALGNGLIIPDRGAWPTDMPGVRQYFTDLSDSNVKTVRAMSDEQLAARVTGVFDRVMAAGTWLGIAHDHEVHHKGQLMLYARMCGVDVPFFIST